MLLFGLTLGVLVRFLMGSPPFFYAVKVKEVIVPILRILRYGGRLRTGSKRYVKIAFLRRNFRTVRLRLLLGVLARITRISKAQPSAQAQKILLLNQSIGAESITETSVPVAMDRRLLLQQQVCAPTTFSVCAFSILFNFSSSFSSSFSTGKTRSIFY